MYTYQAMYIILYTFRLCTLYLYRYRNTYIVDGLLDRRVPLCQHELPLELCVGGAREGDVEVDVAGKGPDIVHGESMESHHGVLKHNIL